MTTTRLIIKIKKYENGKQIMKLKHSIAHKNYSINKLVKPLLSLKFSLNKYVKLKKRAPFFAVMLLEKAEAITFL